MRVLVCGDRNWSSQESIDNVLDGVYNNADGPLIVIEGCARGADSMAERWALDRGIAIRHHPADWETLGRAAGPLRNQKMIEDKPDLVIAFHHNLNVSKGTRDMVVRARRAGVPIRLYNY